MKLFLDDTKLVEAPLFKCFCAETVFAVLDGFQVWKDRDTVVPIYRPIIILVHHPGQIRFEVACIGRIYLMRRKPWIFMEAL
jgi:hypothetical protein